MLLEKDELNTIKTLLSLVKQEITKNPSRFTAFKDLDSKIAKLELSLDNIILENEIKPICIEVTVKDGEVKDIIHSNLPNFLSIFKNVKSYDIHKVQTEFLNRDENGLYERLVF